MLAAYQHAELEFPLAGGQWLQLLRSQDGVRLVVHREVKKPPRERLDESLHEEATEHRRHETGVLPHVAVESQAPRCWIIERLEPHKQKEVRVKKGPV